MQTSNNQSKFNLTMNLSEQHSSKPTNNGLESINCNKLVSLSIDEFVAAISQPMGRTWCPATFKNNKRNAENWLDQQVFSLDFDSGIEPQDVLDTLNALDIEPNIIYATFSDKPEHRKFRLVFILDRKITDKQQAINIILSLMNLFELSVDKACKDVCRMFFASKDSYPEFVNNKMQDTDLFISKLNLIKEQDDESPIKIKSLDSASNIPNIQFAQKEYLGKMILDFNFDNAIRNVQILQDFVAGEWLSHQELFGIASNLRWVDGGLKMMFDTMKKYNKEGITQYTTNNFNILRYLQGKQYAPSNLKSFSKYEFDHQFKNILDAELKEQNVKIEQIQGFPTSQDSINSIQQYLIPEFDEEGQRTKYLSQVMNELPKNCIFNKALTGVGGTHLAIKEQSNTVICVPFKELIKSKMADRDNDFLFVVQAGVSIKQITSYIQKQLNANQLIKIITTYDGLCKVLDAADLMTELVNGESVLKSINLLVDEYHLLFTQYCFRDSAIKCILESFRLFKSFCFLTATPLELDFTLKELQDVPRINAKWEAAESIKVESIKCNSVQATLANTILNRLNDTKPKSNLYIFVNSVQFIKEMIEICKLNKDNTRIIYSEYNKTKLSIARSSVSECKDNPLPITFLTSTCFEGCDVFDEIGYTIIVSDSNKTNTLMDISTSFIQIAGGRIRNSIYKNKATHLYTKTRYSEDLSYDEFKQNTEIGIAETLVAVSDLNKNNQSTLKKIKPEESEYLVKVIDEDTNRISFEFDANLVLLDLYNFKVAKCLYTPMSLKTEYTKNNIQVNSSEDLSKLNKGSYTDWSFKASILFLREQLNADLLNQDKEIPMFDKEDSESYNAITVNNILAKYDWLESAIRCLGYNKMEELDYHQYNIKACIINQTTLSDEMKVVKILKETSGISNGNWLSMKDAKAKVKKIYDNLSINKTPNIRDWFEVKESTKRINGELTKGVILIRPKISVKI